VQITVFKKDGGNLSKHLSLDADGRLVKDGSPCAMSEGKAQVQQLSTETLFADLAEKIDTMTSNEALALGSIRDVDGSTPVKVVCGRSKLNGAEGVICRDKKHMHYRRNEPAMVLLDYDTSGMPDAVRRKVEQAGGFYDALAAHVWPDLGKAGCVMRASTSSGLTRADTGEALPESDGQHVYIAIHDGTDSPRLLRAIQARCWLYGLAWHKLSADGKLLDRSIIDTMVGSPERLVFEGAPTLSEPLQQGETARRSLVRDGPILDSRRLGDLTPDEERRVADIKRASEEKLRGPAMQQRDHYVAEQVDKLVKSGQKESAARKVVESRSNQRLLGSDTLYLADGRPITVADVLNDPADFDGKALADPIEGPGYGRTTATIFANASGFPVINSFAHGGCVYHLRHDFETAKTAVGKLPADEAAAGVFSILDRADILESDTALIIARVAEITGRGKRAMGKDWRAFQSKAQAKKRHHKERTKAEPAIQFNSGMLAPAVEAAIRVMSDQHPAWLFQRGPFICRVVHADHDIEIEDRRIKIPHRSISIKNLNSADCQLRLAQISYWFASNEDGDTKAIDPPPQVVQALLSAHGDWTMPILLGATSVPLLTANGQVDAVIGYHPESQLYYDGSAPDLDINGFLDRNDAIAACDVLFAPFSQVDLAEGDIGRAVLLSYILTGVIRSQLPTAPIHLFSAPVPGAGKGLVIECCNLIVYGVNAATMPALTGHTRSVEEEERKRITAVLLRGISSLHIDNIDTNGLGSVALNSLATSDVWSDRILGKSETAELPARVLLSASGNNVEVRGDSVRRVVRCHIDPRVEKPEQRAFEIVDLAAYCLDHRQELLQAAFTILAAYRQAGRPGGRDRLLGRFETWSEDVAGAIRWVGLPDPVESQATVSANDPVTSTLRELLSAWYAMYEQAPHKAKNAIKDSEPELAFDIPRDQTSSESFDDRKARNTAHKADHEQLEKIKADLREAIEQAVGSHSNVAHRLSLYLRKHKDRIIDGLAFYRGEDNQGTATWSVRSVEG
jgi:hypothetical protein